MRRAAFVGARITGVVLTLWLWGCGAGGAAVGGGDPDGTGTPATDGGTKPTGQSCKPSTESCDGIDNDCDGLVDEDFDQDGDGISSCLGDCNDGSADIYPGAPETKNGVDDDCDQKVDNKIAGQDFDKDGTPFPEDCNDEEPLVGPLAIEVKGDGTDNDCNGTVDEDAPDCEAVQAAGLPAQALASIGVCASWVVPNSVAAGTVNPDGTMPVNKQAMKLTDGTNYIPQRGSWLAAYQEMVSVRSRFGAAWQPKQGSKMLMLSTGLARDNYNTADVYKPQSGKDYFTSIPHPLWTKPKCGTTSPMDYANDVAELRLQLKVPQNAKSFRFQFNFFTAEYPEFVCKSYNDRFIVGLQSKNFVGNIAFDTKGEPVTVNNGFFSVCEGTGCTQSATLLEKTGYDLKDSANRPIGGATGWLSTVAPVTPGEEITLRFIVLDEDDHIYDSAVLIDAFEWDVTPVTAPSTTPVLQ